MNTLSHKTIAVTGGTGLLGSHLTAQLLLEGCTVRLLVRDPQRRGLLPETLQRMGVADRLDRITWVETELNNPLTLNESLRGVQVLFHCAARVSFEPGHEQEILSSNTECATHIANAALACGIELLVHVSSSATLGRPLHPHDLITEQCILNSLVGRSAYSISKIYAENIIQRAMLQGLRAVIVNPALILGEGSWRHGSGELVALASRGLPFYTSGVKGYVDVRDVVQAMIRLAENPQAVGERFIISGANLSFQDLFAGIAHAAGRAKPFLPLGRNLLHLLLYLDREWAH
ncbi:MAG: NAD-dependent epimerase/dehydratase family protein, partial [Alistipes sp.]|nr:NAD-dependent epimerase/dehydratase family protein [Alistipes sp.]